MKFLDLFSGIGGFAKPLVEAGHECVGFSEIDGPAIQVYKKHFPNHINHGDITRIDTSTIPDFDLLVGGFPCQAFSIAGKRMGFEDTRGTLFFEVARIIRDKRPKLFLLENVKGLLSHDEQRTFETILCTLSELGYGVEWQVLNSKDFGVPQSRERVFIVGYSGGFSRQKIFPLRQRVKSDPNRNRGRICYPTLCTYWGARGKGRIPPILQGGRYRAITPTEEERLQGFPDGWTEDLDDEDRYRCLGNAVTTNVIKEIIKNLL